jgi:hypothetical protein
MVGVIVIFDCDGRFHDGRSASFPDHLDASIGGEMLRDYVARNMGYVAITHLSGSTRVQVRPSQVSMFAFGAALKWLSKSRAERFTIACFNGGQWHEQVFVTRRNAIAHLTAAVFANDNLFASLTLAECPTSTSRVAYD